MRHYVFLLLGSLLLLSSCAHKGKKYRTIPAGRLVEKHDISARIEEAKSLHDLGEIDAAIANLRLVVDNNAYNPLHDQAYELIIEWLLQVQKNDEAKRLASYFLSNHKDSPSVEKIIELFNIPKGIENQKIIPPTEEKTPETIEEQVLELEKVTPESPDLSALSKDQFIEFVLYKAPLTTVETLAEKKKVIF